MTDYEKAIFISYAWGGESERTVDELERAFAARGLRIVRDKKDLGYKGSIQAFEQRLGQGQCVILVVSDKYLRSEHCMFELVEAAENRDLRARLFPLVLADARIYSAVERLAYIQYWDAKIAELNQAIKDVQVMTNLAGVTADLDKYARIRARFDHLTDLLSDMNALTPEIHAASGYATLIEAVERAMESSGSTALPDAPAPARESKPSPPVGAGGVYVGGNVGGDVVTGTKITQKAGAGSTQIGQARDINISQGPVYNIEGGIHSGRDTVMSDQVNYNFQGQAAPHIQTAPQFAAELLKLQMQISALLQQTELTNAQRRNLQAAQEQAALAAAEAQKPQPDDRQVQQTLGEAKETMELLSGSLKSAAGLGALLGGLIQIAAKLFDE